MTDPLADLSSHGVSIWLDDLSRQRLVTGSLADLVAHDHVVGVTTNPTIFARAITSRDDYADQIRDLRARGAVVGEALHAMTAFDVRWACDVLRPVYDATGGTDGRVSIEVDPRLAYDTEATIAEARFLWWLVDRPNLFIKIPAARQGLPAIAACLAEGISINVTLIFSLSRYDELVLARAIPFRTVCEHHLLPFSGVAHVGYLPADRIVGLSKLARLTEHFAARPQTQERLTRQIADSLDAHLAPRGAGVVLEAEHSCMTLRGVRALGAKTVTSALLGALRADPRSRAEFFSLAGVPS